VGLTTPMKPARREHRAANPLEKKVMTTEVELSEARTPPCKGSMNKKQQTIIEKEEVLQAQLEMNDNSKGIEQKKDKPKDNKWEEVNSNRKAPTESQKEKGKDSKQPTFADKVKLGVVKAKFHLLFKEANKKMGKVLGTDQRERKHLLYGKLKFYMLGMHTTAKMQQVIVQIVVNGKSLDK